MGARRPLAFACALLAGTAVSLAAAPAAFADLLWPEAGGSPNADATRDLYLIVAAISIPIFLLVEGLLFYNMRRFRARKGMVAAQIHGNTRLEIGWTVGAFVILVFITIVTFIFLADIKDPDAPETAAASQGAAQYASTDQPEPPAGSDPLRIRVDGQQYVWRYQYPGRERVFSYVDMIVPVGRTVILEITSDDVQHSWWIPELGGKMDALPGYTNYSWFRATKEGTFPGQCAELCGRNHADMVANVRALPQAEYDDWYRGKVAEIQADRRAAAERQQALEAEQGPQASESGGAAGGAAPAE